MSTRSAPQLRVLVALLVASLAAFLVLAGCSSTPVHQPGVMLGGGCDGGYKLVATAPTWRRLADKLAEATTIAGDAHGIRTVKRGHLTDSWGHHVNRYVDLLNRRGRRLLQVEVWWEPDRTWRASYYVACY